MAKKMRKKLWQTMIILWSSVLSISICITGAHSQTKTGTTVGQFLLIEPSARVSAMGNAGATLYGEVMSSFYNPGVISLLQHSDAQFAYNSWYAGIALNTAMISIRLFESGTALLSMTNLSSGDIDVRTVEHPEGTGERYTTSDIALGVGYGMKVTDRFSFGIHFNFIQERIWHSSISFFAINIGTLYQLSTDGLRVGASLSNFSMKNSFDGSDLRVRYDIDPSRYGDNSNIPAEILTDEYVLPIVFRVGFGYPLTFNEDFKAIFSIDALHPSDNSESLNMGGELFFKDFLALRGGYQSLFLKDSEVGLTVGGGVKWDGMGYEVRFDYAYAAHQRLGDTYRITLGFGF